MSIIMCLKEVPVEVDLAIEASGYTPVYSHYGNTALDMRRVTHRFEDYLVDGVFDEERKTFAVYAVHQTDA